MEYFATLDSEEIGTHLMMKIDEYYNYISRNKLLDLWQKSHQLYYAGYYWKGKIQKEGAQNEKRRIHINLYKRLIQQLKVLTVDQKPMFEARSLNDDYSSHAETLLTQGIIEYYMRQKRLDKELFRVVDYSIKYGEGWLVLGWDWTKGEDYAVQGDDIEGEIEEIAEKEKEKRKKEKGKEVKKREPKIQKAGDVYFNAYMPVDIIRDVTKRDLNNQNWYIVREFVNKYDLASKYPDFEDEITTGGVEEEYKDIYVIKDEYKTEESDKIILYKFFHQPTEAMPEGRYIEFIDNSNILFDGVYPYNDFTLYKLVPDDLDARNFGYTVAFDLMAVQDGLDGLNSTIVTNQNMFGIQNVLAPAGHNMSASEIARGLRIITYTGTEKPEPLNLLSTPRELFSYIEKLEKYEQTLAGVNEVTMGDPGSNIKSGNYAALLQSMVVQFSTALQNNYSSFLEDVGSGLVGILKKYATVEKTIYITGKSNTSYAKQFRNEDIMNIDRVIVDMGNPLSRTKMGRLQMADNVLQHGFIKVPEEYINVLNTGRLEPIMEGETKELMLIRGENEKLSEGEGQPVTAVDCHTLHIREHRTVLSSPEARLDGNVVKVVLDHIMGHINQLQTQPPELMQLIGEPSLMPMPVVPPSEGNGKNPKGEGMPQNAMTGQEFDTQTGGGVVPIQ